MDYCCIVVPYVSVWDGGIEIQTVATVNIITGEVTGIGTVNAEGLDICESEYIVMNDERVYVYHGENGFEHWADINNEFL